jgi:hypothetical protein
MVIISSIISIRNTTTRVIKFQKGYQYYNHSSIVVQHSCVYIYIYVMIIFIVY